MITPSQDKVLVALSGGVDSSIAVQILKQQDFAPVGLVISFSTAHSGAVAAAEKAAQELEIPLVVRHCEDDFEAFVVQPFCSDYTAGLTPNPCIQCNPSVKFKILAEEANKMGIHYIATGHYARIEEQNGIFYLAQAESAARDQSYMLYRLPQSILSRLCLPVGEFEKADIREMAKEAGLSNSEAPDSQEICFIPEGNYAGFISGRGHESPAGNFISPEGKILDPHKGLLHYTIGQRRGVGLALGKPVFVKSMLPNGDIQLGYAGEEFSSSITLDNLVFTGDVLPDQQEYLVKIRSAAKPAPCFVEKDGANLNIRFVQPLRAPAPGQHAVLYRDGLVMGGGRIIRFD